MKGFIFDLDGTIYLGEHLIEGALQTYSHLISEGHKVVFVTNKPIATREDYLGKLKKFGFDVTLDQIVNSNYALAIFLGKHLEEGQKVLVIGEDAVLDELREANIAVTEDETEAAFVALSWDREFTYDKLNKAFQAWKLGAKIVATNPDRTCPVEGGEIPDCGAMIGALEGATGEKITNIAGKPSKLMVDLVVNDVLNLPYEDCYMIGDRLETDIKMGNESGLQTILVLSGVTSAEMAEESPIKATYTLDSVEAIPAL